MAKWTVEHWKSPTKIAVVERVGAYGYRVIADFWQPEVTEEEALWNANLLATAYNEMREARFRSPRAQLDAIMEAAADVVMQVDQDPYTTPNVEKVE